ncbi:MAG TPA: valine--tRNA ligase, partial [Candidatus Saccharimonadales bacterium]
MKLPKTYEPAKYESTTYELWEKSGAFEPGQGKNTFSIVMPPPNANAPLHIGHALTNAVQDVMVRYHRLKGDSTLYLPGADHAGFETWVVYEKQLNKEGKTRFDFSRDELFAQVWDFVAQNRGTMEQQVRAMGASVDWSRYTFTLDPHIVSTAYDSFKQMWDDDLIYRGERIVNYCTVHDTSFSDIEVEHIPSDTKLRYIKYPLTDGSGQIEVATTRPETMLGDTAVAVNSKDKRYKDFIGKTAKLPLTHREIPILGDEAIDMEFGTGAVKVTPAHDQTDFEIAERHDLPAISIIGFDGKITGEAPAKYRGMDVNTARQAVIEDLKAGKLLSKEEDYQHTVSVCYKCKNLIEPLLKDQWFIRMRPLADKAIEAIKADRIRFYPANKKTHAIRYLENVRDWNISRQIAWGIPIPAFRSVDNPDEWKFDTRVDQEMIDIDGQHYTRDPDVFDTWFSSGQWPYATLKFPDGHDFKRFYPTSVMETGGEIFNQWVLRMIMLGLYRTGQVPFKEVYIHGHVLAADGTKMSKSLGNVLNPMEVIEEHGSDALRMGLISGRTAGSSGAFSSDKIVGARNFANKLWNIARFTESILGDKFSLVEDEAKTPADHWWLKRYNQGLKTITTHLDEHRYSEAYETLYHLVWNDYADWYLEASKAELNKDMLAEGLKNLLILAHPFAPFVSEAIWQTLEWTEGQLITQRWPKPGKPDKKLSQEFDRLKDIIVEIRELKAALKLRENTLYHKGDKTVEDNKQLLIKMGKVVDVKQVESGAGLHLSQAEVHAWLDVEHGAIKNYLKSLE